MLDITSSKNSNVQHSFRFLVYGSQPHSSNIPPGHRSESNPHSLVGHYRRDSLTPTSAPWSHPVHPQPRCSQWKFSPIPEQKLHTAGIHVELAGSFIVLHVCVLSALRHSHSGLSCFLMIRSRTFFDGSKGFVLFSEESKSPAELVVVVRSSYPIQKHSPTLAKEKPKRGCIQ